jgi:hypothetical protein
MGIRRNEQMIVKNRLTQVGRSFRAADSRRRRHAVFECACGARKVLLIEHVDRARTKSCGCWNDEVLRNRSVTHGSARKGKLTSTYRSWRAMRKRCSAKTGHHAERYTNRGISVCKEWDSFEQFLHDMGDRPEGTTLERIDNDRGYEKSNCCWASKRVQARNTSKTIRVMVDGKEMCLRDACEETGVPYARAYQRITKLGWSPDRALSE